MNALDSIEREHRAQARALASEFPAPRWWAGALIGFAVSPFAVATSLFVPFFGQLLAIGAAILGGYYLYIKRSLRLTVASVAGAALSLVTVSFVGANYWAHAEIIGYLFFGFSVAVMVAFWIFIGSAIWNHFERGALEYDKKKSHLS